MQSIIRAAAYCRVSTDRQDQANSFDSQQRYFRDYIQLKENWELYQIYADEGISGTDAKRRPAFLRMIHDGLEGQFQVILTKEVSRFSRNILDTIAYTRKLKQAGVAVYFLTDGFHTMEPDSELKLSIMASLAQEESRRTGSRVSWGQQRQMERGVVFGRDLLGYRVKNGKLFVEPDGAETVALIFRKYALEGESIRQIARYLTENAIPNRDGSLLWSGSSVGKILRNEKYVGDLVQRKTYTTDYLTHKKAINRGQVPYIVLRDHHQPIVGRDLWEKAQQRLKHNSSFGSHSSRCTLSGMVHCGQCGANFVARRKGSGEKGYRRWCCSSAACQGSILRQTPDGKQFGCDIGRLLRDDDGIQMIRTALKWIPISWNDLIQKVIFALCQETKQTNAALQKQRQRIIIRRQSMLDSFFAGDISREDMVALKKTYDARLDTLKPIETLTLDPEEIRAFLTEILDGNRDSPQFDRTILESITVFRDRPKQLRLKNLDAIFFFS